MRNSDVYEDNYRDKTQNMHLVDHLSINHNII